jgi:hypothetical protein
MQRLSAIFAWLCSSSAFLSSSFAQLRLLTAPCLHILFSAHVQLPQSSGFVGVRELPLDQRAPSPQPLLAAIATDSLPVDPITFWIFLLPQ